MTREGLFEDRLPWVAALFGIAVTLPAVTGGFVWDDRWLILQNPVLRDPGVLGRVLLEGHGWGSMVPEGDTSAYYRPLAGFLHGLILILFGANPLPFRILMTLLHGMTSLALGFTLRARTPRAAWGAILFAVHPALADAFGWISATADLLAALLLLAAIAAIDRPRPRHVVAGLLWLGALLAKESAAVGLAWITILWWSDREGARRQFLLPSALTIVSGMAAYLAIRAIGPGFHAPIGEYPVGTEATGAVLSGKLFLADLSRLIFPIRITLDPPAWVTKGDGALLGGIGIVTALLFTAACLFLLARRGSGAASRSLTLGFLLCLTALLPVLQITPTNDIFGGRFLYLPAAGLCMGVGRAVAAWRRPVPLWTGIALLVALGGLGVRSAIRAGEWRDEASLFGGEHRRQPDGMRGRMLWGNHLLELGRTDEARSIIEGVAATEPEDRRVRALQALLWMKEGRLAEAEAAFRELAKTGPQTPTLLANLAACQMRLGRVEEGLSTLDRATRLTPPTPGMRNNRGNALRLLGRVEEARREFETAIEEDRSYLPARVNLIALLAFDLGDTRTARASAEEFLRLYPRVPESESVRAILDTLQIRSGRLAP